MTDRSGLPLELAVREPEVDGDLFVSAVVSARGAGVTT